MGISKRSVSHANSYNPPITGLDAGPSETVVTVFPAPSFACATHFYVKHGCTWNGFRTEYKGKCGLPLKKQPQSTAWRIKRKEKEFVGCTLADSSITMLHNVEDFTESNVPTFETFTEINSEDSELTNLHGCRN